jgi:hypothetical protein
LTGDFDLAAGLFAAGCLVPFADGLFDLLAAAAVLLAFSPSLLLVDADLFFIVNT